MNRILTMSIASTLILASIAGTALAKGGHDHGGDHANAGHGIASHDSLGSGNGPAVAPGLTTGADNWSSQNDWLIRHTGNHF